MRNPQRIDNILNRLKIVWKDNPDLRLGQLLLCVTDTYRLLYIEDEALIQALENYFLSDCTKRSNKSED